MKFVSIANFKYSKVLAKNSDEIQKLLNENIRNFNELRRLSKDIKSEEIQEKLEMLALETSNLKSDFVTYYQDQGNLGRLEKELLARMDENELYREIDQKTRQQMVNAIISSNDKELLTEETFNDWLQQVLNDETDDEKLIGLAYDTEQIKKLGTSLSPGNATETTKYKKGLEALEKQVSIPKEHDAAVQFAIKNITEDPVMKENYLKKYYEVSGSEEGEKG